MADWLVGPVVDRIINACSDYLQDQFRWQTGMKEELERLRVNHPKIQAVVSAFSTQADISDQNPALNDWIWLLRDAIDEADDLLDELEYMKLKKQLIKNKKRRKVRLAISFLKRTGQRALKIDPYLKRLTEVVQKLDKVSAEVGTFLHLAENAKQQQQKQELELYKTRETGSLPKNDLVGRGKDMEFVMQWLRNPSNEDPTHITLYKNISLLSIVGHGGMGKTALLQHVYQDLKEEFDLKMWVCVSNNFEVKKVIADMLECLKMKKPDVESLDALQRSLKSEVMSKKFLLVLDDVWEEEQESDKSKWENVFSPLAYGTLGSKILVTTRMDSVATVIAKVIKKKKKTLRLKGLGDDESLQLLNIHAFADVENLDNHKQLRSIAREIVKTLSGSPLAIKVVGGVLSSSLNVSHWIRVLNSDIGSASLGQSNIMHILRLSYKFLPRPLQNCFTFCSIFPQDHNFIRDDLVKMWISLGFIQTPSISGETMEDIGGKCFDILVKKSFFDNFEPYYKMHDFLHELAQSISAQECFRVVGDKEPFRILKTIRHLFVETSNIEVLRKIIEFKNLHSLFLRYRGDDQDFIQILTELFKSLRRIRLMFIYHMDLKLIPEEIANLIHLRYLNKIAESLV
ncbi:putative disease resistance protein RGA3 isoform X2 [Phalaenopsis equestris]|uniref:putative disease resistance protein RGA3 isoform X2 n=1 Tax=Phalaenopsis equestris TaxID=78828 RepID=UPI0009E39202|nr:putative disease resistance protein RGA3 isoform X2 [Phalaenopsis equestris]